MKAVFEAMKRLHHDDGGAEGLEKLLIIAAIVLPLLGLLIVFRQSIGKWVSEMWDNIRGQSDVGVPQPTQ